MIYIITFVTFLGVMLMMAVGVIFSKKRLKGSCGGLASVGIEKSCDCKDTCEETPTLYQIQEPSK